MRRSNEQLKLSTAIVKHLQKQHKLREIAAFVGLSESFLSRVAKGERKLAEEDLITLAKAVGVPLPALIIEATYKDDVSDRRREMLEEAARLVREADELAKLLDEETEASTGPTPTESPASSKGVRAAARNLPHPLGA